MLETVVVLDEEAVHIDVPPAIIVNVTQALAFLYNFHLSCSQIIAKANLLHDGEFLE